ncbi:hypothetical protein PSHT_09822 [Puccinia striiformis]|uniref:DUF6589 domain-containing protein n=1 Tax=Puccinia striiformis TaxID=27350 RepID=A0A2S4VE09_9BASI|nr:hypothetical protein PSHT_09822 [Puccinia striiformis]
MSDAIPPDTNLTPNTNETISDPHSDDERISMEEKLISICKFIGSTGLDPKRFIFDFMSSSSADIASRRRLYGTHTGWKSTEKMLKSVKKLAIDIVKHEEPPRGTYPGGLYINSSKIDSSFFTDEERVSRNQALTDGMPFLYRLLQAKLGANCEPDVIEYAKDHHKDLASDDEEDEAEITPPALDAEALQALESQTTETGQGKEPFNLTESDINQYEGVFLAKSPNPAIRKRLRMETMARTICAMVAFGVNRRNNAFQLSNSLVFIASGVTERVNRYLNYIGLTSSRKTAHLALKTLGKEAENCIIERFSLDDPNSPAPLICFDNLDFQQKVHMKSVGHQSTMFHGTWGFIHSTPSLILRELDPAELTTEALNKALHEASKLVITPETFAPTSASVLHFEATLKSQITKVILEYVAVASDDRLKLEPNPPPVEPLDPITPDIPIPGAAHTLWNMSQAIFLAHWGNEKLASDTGAWRFLDALGIKGDKPVTKKDFNLMLSHIEKIHEATLVYFVLSVMNKAQEPLAQERRCMSSEAINHLVQKTFHCFCSGGARRAAAAAGSVSHLNTLLHVRDFATILEANRAMKAGDPGRLMYMWERWAVMGQALPNLPHYSRHLPKLILMIKTVLPKCLATVVKSSLLISPTGRSDHFVATDFFLEVQNYWLKYFYNHSGIGTNERLKDVFSINIPTLRFLMQSLKIESGTNVTHQSHKNQLKNLDINNFLRMADAKYIALVNSTAHAAAITTDTYASGIQTLKTQYRSGIQGLDCFRLTAPGIYQLYDEIQNSISSMDLESLPGQSGVLSDRSGSEFAPENPEDEDVDAEMS